MNRIIAFDLGNVIFNFDYTIAFEKLKGFSRPRNMKPIEDFLCRNFSLDFEKGLLTPREFYKEFSREFLFRASFEDFKQAWNSIFWVNHPVPVLLEKLSKTYPLYLISNINELHFENIRSKYPEIVNLFSGLVLSFRIKSIKPQKAIYASLRDVCQREYREIIYIDDRLELIEAAGRMGIVSLHFKDYASLVKDLKGIGVKI
ncbi:MAG: HAD hydrolase-like protein [Candidatus Omnitrophica bacterium]|nr:HAD hydrolase-like protein [Candidatus Omnitrophota bacterium]MBD3268930.1 HAD hydrolase-like protein [Candidatus Omnitrophota bacterium]